MHQLITLDARKQAKEITEAGVGVGNSGNVEGLRCFPPIPSMTMNVTALGNHVKLSYLSIVCQQSAVIYLRRGNSPVDDSVSTECNLKADQLKIATRL